MLPLFVVLLLLIIVFVTVVVLGFPLVIIRADTHPTLVSPLEPEEIVISIGSGMRRELRVGGHLYQYVSRLLEYMTGTMREGRGRGEGTNLIFKTQHLNHFAFHLHI